MEHSHAPEDIRERIRKGPETSYLRDWVYGGIDGAVTTFAIVAGVVGADLAPRVILILGAANIVADGFSMAASNYSGTKAELDNYRRQRRSEERQIAEGPEGERAEIREIFRAKGFEGDDLERAVDVITSDEEQWIEAMMTGEYGLPPIQHDPMKSAIRTFTAFLVCGLAPLLPFLFGLPHPFVTAILSTAAVFFGIGSAKSLWSPQSWWRSGIETLAIGLGAAAIAWAIGHLLRTAFL